MKHPWKTTLLLLLLFIASQIVGLGLVSLSIERVERVGGQVTLAHTETAIGERPQLSGFDSFLYLVLGVLLGTAIMLVLIRFRKVRIWKAWFLFAVFLAMAVSFGVLTPRLLPGSLPSWAPNALAMALALGLALWKIYRPNPLVHNLTEVFIYAGIAVLLVPIFSVFWMLVVLLAISVYDMIAVWKTRHMVAMAEFQKSSSVFAGLMVPRAEDAKTTAGKAGTSNASKTTSSTSITSSTKSTTTARTMSPAKTAGAPPASMSGAHAILGGGDIAFPLLFAGVVMESLVMQGLSKAAAFAECLIIVATTTIALLLLFYFAKKDRYYPAMPFVTLGCLAGWGLTLLL